MAVNPPVPDGEIRQAAFLMVQRRAMVRGDLTGKDLAEGFVYQGRRIPLVNPQRGIFKPQQMGHLNRAGFSGELRV